MATSVDIKTITITSGAAASSAFSLAPGQRISAVIGDTAWTAADISFEMDNGAGTFVKVVDSAGALVKITGVNTGASEYMVVPEIADLIVGQRAKVVSSNTASEADVNQGSTRTLRVVLGPVGGG